MPSSSQTIRVGSLNVWGMFADWPSRFEALKAHPVISTLDVLLSQEVCVGDGVNQLEDLAETFNLPYYAYHSDKQVRGLNEGVAIFSKKPLTTIGRTNLGNGRVLVQADSFNGLTLASAHLSFEGRERTEQVKALLKRMTLNRVILGADFNGELSTFAEALDKYWAESTDDEPTWPVCTNEFFENAWRAHTGRDINFSLEPRRVDYILTRGVKPVSSETMTLKHDGQYVSDHALVISELLV